MDSDTLIIFRFTQHKCTHCLRQTLNCILQSSTGTIWFHLGASVKREGGELVLHSIHITIIKHSFFFYFLFKHKVFWVLSFGRQHELDTVYVEHRTRRTNDEQSLPAKCIVCEEKVCAVRRLHCVPCPVVFLFFCLFHFFFSLSLALSVCILSLSVASDIYIFGASFCHAVTPKANGQRIWCIMLSSFCLFVSRTFGQLKCFAMIYVWSFRLYACGVCVGKVSIMCCACPFYRNRNRNRCESNDNNNRKNGENLNLQKTGVGIWLSYEFRKFSPSVSTTNIEKKKTNICLTDGLQRHPCFVL